MKMTLPFCWRLFCHHKNNNNNNDRDHPVLLYTQYIHHTHSTLTISSPSFSHTHTHTFIYSTTHKHHRRPSSTNQPLFFCCGVIHLQQRSISRIYSGTRWGRARGLVTGGLLSSSGRNLQRLRCDHRKYARIRFEEKENIDYFIRLFSRLSSVVLSLSTD